MLDVSNHSFVFLYTCPAKSKDEGRGKSLPIIEKCERFTRSMHLSLQTDMPLYKRGRSLSRFTFTIQGSQKYVFWKTSALFELAASLKLALVQ